MKDINNLNSIDTLRGSAGAGLPGVITSNQQLWHKFTADTWTGSDRLSDSSANTNTGALYTGRGLSFDGINNYIDIGNPSELDFERTDPFSIIFTFSGSTAGDTIISKRDASTTFRGINIFLSGTSGELNFHLLNDNATGNELRVRTPLAYNDGNLYHVVFTYDGTNTPAGCGCYINGSTISLNTIVNGLTGTIQNSVSWEIGADTTNSNYFAGTILDVLFFDIELSASEVTDLYQNPEKIVPTGVSSSNLVAWWPMSEGEAGGIVFDGSGNENHGTNNGATETFALPSPVRQTGLKGLNTPMVNGGSGSGDYVDCGNDSSISITTNVSVSAWVTLNSLTTPQGIVGKWDANGYLLFISNTGFVTFYIQTAYAIYSLASAGVGLTDLVHFAGTWDGTTIRLYLNGSEVHTAAQASISNSANNLFIGKDNSTSYYDGIIFNSSVYNSQLTPAEITEIYNGGVNFDLTSNSGNYVSSANLQAYYKNTGNTDADWVDLSTNSNDGTVNGSPETILLTEGLTAGQDQLGFNLTESNSNYLYLDNTGYAQVEDDATLDITTNITIEAWVKLHETGSAQTIIGKDDAYALTINASNQIQFRRWSTTEGSIAGSTALSVDTWYHVSATYDGVNAYVFLNGVQDGTGALSGAIDATATDLYMGSLDGTNETVVGMVDSAKVYNTNLTSSQLLRNYRYEKSSHIN